MLIEIFDNNIYCKKCRNKESEPEIVPMRKIHLTDNALSEKYIIAADFINGILNPENKFHSMYVVEDTQSKTNLTLFNSITNFEFGYDILDDNKETIIGKISIGPDNNIMNYTRFYNNDDTNALTGALINTKNIIPSHSSNDPKSTGYNFDLSHNPFSNYSQFIGSNSYMKNIFGEIPVNFPNRNTGDEENSSLKELTASCKDSGIPEEIKTVESDNGINILSNGAIEFESEDVSISEDSTTLEAKKKASQDAFMTAMNEKFKKSINNSSSK